MEVVRGEGRFRDFEKHLESYAAGGRIVWPQGDSSAIALREAAHEWALELGWRPEGEAESWTPEKCRGKILGEIPPKWALVEWKWPYGAMYAVAVCGRPVFCTASGAVL